MLIVKGRSYLKPGEIDRLRPALTQFVEETRQQDGCLSYHYAVDLIDPNLLHIEESWRDKAAKDAHMQDLGSLLVALEAAQMECLVVRSYDATFVETIFGDEAEATSGPRGAIAHRG